jgi:uncharacterized protein YmfQ (DUF2313 family)
LSALFTQSDYGAALSALRPRGRVWPTDPDSVQVQTLTACAGSFERLDAGAQNLLVDAFPATTVDLLPEWQSSLGLPDPCVGPGATLQQSQAQVVARLTGIGGVSRADYIAYAAALGFTISIVTYTPFRCGFGTCGSPLGGPDWAFAWGVDVTASTQGFADSVLLCEFQALKPAETTVFLTS